MSDGGSLEDGGVTPTPSGVPGSAPDGGPTGDTPTAGATAQFRDRLLPSAGVWLATASVASLFGVAGLRMGVLGGVISFLIVFGLVGGSLVSTAPRIEVAEGMFVVGAARIPVSLLGEAQTLDAEQWRLAVGQELDARAFLCIRGWIKQGVRVQLQDPQDPTPYWVVSTRRPAELTAALAAAHISG